MPKGVSVEALCKDFAENTTCHGCGNLVRSKNWFLRILWILLICGAFFMLGRQFVQLFFRYQSKPINTNIAVSTSPLPFPSVTLCNLNSIRMSALYDVSDESIKKLRKLLESIQMKESDEMSQNMGTRKKRETVEDEHVDGSENYDAIDVTDVNAGMNAGTGDPKFDAQVSDSPADPNTPFDNCGPTAPGASDPSALNYDNYGGDGYSSDDYYGGMYDSGMGDTGGGMEEMDNEYLVKQKIVNYISRLPKNVSKALGHEKETFIHKCSFMGRKCDLDKHFTDYWSTRYGNCFTFNSNEARDKSIIVARSGQEAALELTLNLEHHEYTPMHTTGYGSILVIHDFGTYPFPSQQGIAIPAGYHSFISLAMKNVTRLDKPYGNCVKGELFQEKYKKKYTYEACVTTCTHAEIFKRCNCYQQGALQYYEGSVDPDRPCDSSEDVKCLREVRREMRGKLTCNCEQPCSETVFETAPSMHQWPEKKYMNYLVEEACKSNKSLDVCNTFKTLKSLPNDFRNTLASLSIYYRGLNYEEISQHPAYLLPNFLSDLGGTLGLWAGFSILTCTEVVLFILHLLKQGGVSVCCSGQKKKPEKSVDGTDDKKELADKSDEVV